MGVVQVITAEPLLLNLLFFLQHNSSVDVLGVLSTSHKDASIHLQLIVNNV
jgi:hypothetical protein